MLVRKAGLFIFTIALLIGASALLPNPAATGLAPSLYAQKAAPAAQLSAERATKHVQFLASDKLQGRRAGTSAADEAAAYIEKEFRSYGLKPASSAGFRQPFNFVSGVKLGEQNSFTVKTASGSRSLKVGEEFMPLAFSSSDPVSGELLFAGYGISAPGLFDSYSGIDPKDKIVLILRGSPDGDNPHGKFAEFTQPGLEIQNKTLKARERCPRSGLRQRGEKL